MDLKITSTNFQGKSEILYGLKKAADKVHSYTILTQPRLQRLGENKEIIKYEIAANAYLDMVTKDGDFVNIVKKLSADDLKQVRVNLETPKELQLDPIKNFANFLYSVMNRNGTNSATEKKAAKTLLNKISESL